MEEHQTTICIDVKVKTENAKKQIKDLKNETEDLTKSMVAAFQQVIVNGKDAEEVFKALAFNFSQKSFSKAIKPVETGIGDVLGIDAQGLFGSNGLIGSILGFAKGGVTSNRGGVVTSPIGFPLGGGQFGVAGEAGPEAILPLTRGPNGELGVRSRGTAPSSIIVNISTPDIESFRRSEGEISASLQRIVSRGNRNL